jgi:hypothetical protein
MLDVGSSAGWWLRGKLVEIDQAVSSFNATVDETLVSVKASKNTG